MRPILWGVFALLILQTHPGPAACAPAQAAAPFPVVPLEEHSSQSHMGSYVCIGGGVALTVASFAIAHEADQTYDQYLVETDPARIESLYDRTVKLDRWSRGTLLTGQALIVTGLYLRFIRRPPAGRVSLIVEPYRCALAVRF
ncbi:MAG: hypothetical protein ACHQ52_10945 [Candidatus Eisenbacteria bacterium]